MPLRHDLCPVQGMPLFTRTLLEVTRVTRLPAELRECAEGSSSVELYTGPGLAFTPYLTTMLMLHGPLLVKASI